MTLKKFGQRRNNIPPLENYHEKTETRELQDQQPICNICGKGKEVGNPDATAPVPGSILQPVPQEKWSDQSSEHPPRQSNRQFNRVSHQVSLRQLLKYSVRPQVGPMSFVHGPRLYGANVPFGAIQLAIFELTKTYILNNPEIDLYSARLSDIFYESQPILKPVLKSRRWSHAFAAYFSPLITANASWSVLASCALTSSSRIDGQINQMSVM